MTDDLHVVAFTGHRALTDTQARTALAAVNTYLRAQREVYGEHLRVLQGMATGIDQLAGGCCVDLDIPYACVIPHPDYRKVYQRITENDALWDFLIEHAHQVVYVYDAAQRWTPKMNFGRNAQMVKWADELAAVTYWERHEITKTSRPRGGTAHCVQDAMRCNKPITWLQLPR